MWLKLDLDGVDFHFRICNYLANKVSNDYDNQWCNSESSLDFKGWFKYSNIGKCESLTIGEVDELKDNIEKLLSNKLDGVLEYVTLEMDYRYVFYPKRIENQDNSCNSIYLKESAKDIHLDWNFIYYGGYPSNNYISIRLYREELEYLLVYLKIIMGIIDKDNEQLSELIKTGIIYG